MLLTIAIVLLVLWGLGFATHVARGFIHLLLVIALDMSIMLFVHGRGMTTPITNVNYSELYEILGKYP